LRGQLLQLFQEQDHLGFIQEFRRLNGLKGGAVALWQDLVYGDPQGILPPTRQSNQLLVGSKKSINCIFFKKQGLNVQTPRWFCEAQDQEVEKRDILYPKSIDQGVTGALEAKTSTLECDPGRCEHYSGSSITQNYSVRLYIDVKKCRPLGWNLPGNGAQYDMCGHVWYDEGKGCLATKNHPEGLIYVRLVSATCFRAECPICFQKWASRSASRIEERFMRIPKTRGTRRRSAEARAPGLGKPIHVVISVPEAEAHLIHDDFKKLKRIVYAIAKQVGVKGGCSIFHPYANDKMHEDNPEKILIDESTGEFDLKSLKEYYAKIGKADNFWFVRPHFHLICYGWIEKEEVKKIYDKTGYIVKNLGVRESVRLTAHYQLSHCGIKSGVQTVVWFGKLSNRNYKKLNPAPKLKPKKRKCPECENVLNPVRYDPDLPLMLQGRASSPLEGQAEGGHWIDPGGWRYLREGEKNHSCLIQPKNGASPHYGELPHGGR